MSKRILVVDDDAAIQSLLQDLLEEEAYEVDVAWDGLHAWNKLMTTAEMYDVIVLDLQMPRMDGLRLIQLLRRLRDTLLCSILVLSSDRDAIQQAISMGICHALVKPFDLDAVLAQISCCLGERGCNASAS